MIGTLGALGDVASNYDVAQQLGTNLSALISTFAKHGRGGADRVLRAGLPAAGCASDPKPHLRAAQHAQGRDRDLRSRRVSLAVAAAAARVRIGGGDARGHRHVRERAADGIATAGLLVVAFFLSAIVVRTTRPKSRKPRRQSAYVRRLIKFVGTLIVVGVWLMFLELSLRFWGFSIAQMAEESVAARGITHTFGAIVTTFFVVWLVWILIDTCIQEALRPDSTRRGGRRPEHARAPCCRSCARRVRVTAGDRGDRHGGQSRPERDAASAGADVIGLAVGFGAQSLVADLITGLFILIEDTISVGDSIEVEGGHAGIVESLTIRTVRLRDGQGAIHAIPFSQIKTVKNLSRDFAYAVFEVRVPFTADVDDVTQMIREVGAELMADFRYWREMLGPVEMWGLDRFDPNWMVVKGQIKTWPLQQWSVARAFNLRIKRKMDEAGMEIPVPQMHVQMTRAEAVPGEHARRIWTGEETESANEDDETVEIVSAQSRASSIFERLFDFWKETHNLAAANHELLTHINWPQFWAIQLLMFQMIGNYCMFSEIWRPEVFLRWASGLAQSTLEPAGDVRKAGPEGTVTIRFTPHNPFGVVDHTVQLESSDEIYVPLRVFANGDGAEVALTLFRQPGMSDEKFAADADWVRRDLATLAQRFSS